MVELQTHYFIGNFFFKKNENRHGIYRFLMQMRSPEGGFQMHFDGWVYKMEGIVHINPCKKKLMGLITYCAIIMTCFLPFFFFF